MRLWINSFIYLLLLSSGLLPSLCGAEHLHIHIADSYVRENHLLRVEVTASGQNRDYEFPLTLNLQFYADSFFLEQQQHVVHSWADMVQGVVFHKRTLSKITYDTLRCSSTLMDTHARLISRQQMNVASIASLRKEFNQIVTQSDKAKKNIPLLKLRLEQLAHLLSIKCTASDFADIDRWFMDCQLLLADKSIPSRNPVEGAYQARSDKSWQPYRLHLPPTIHGCVVICRDYNTSITKARWPGIPKAWLAQANAQGLACLEVYPAGDRQWRGIAASRINQSLKAALAKHPQLQGKPVYLLGHGLGANGAVAAAMAQPLQYDAVLLSGTALKQQNWWNEAKALAPLRFMPLGCCENLPLFIKSVEALRPQQDRGLLSTVSLGNLNSSKPWLWLKTHGKTPSLDTQELSTWQQAHFSQQPFLCITGKGEHLEAMQRNQDTRQSLDSAWVHHSHGRLPLVSSDEFSRSRHSPRNLIFIGNPFDNNALRVFLKSLPDSAQTLRWNERELIFPNGTILRSNIGSIQWHIRHGDQEIWVLSGPESTLPLGPLPLSQNHQSLIRQRGGKLIWTSE